MTIEHKNISNADLHEPKGVSGANVDEVYVANGAGSGTWTNVGNLNLNGLEQAVLTVKVPDISTPASYWTVSPYAGDIIAIYSVIDGAISGADCVLSFEINGVAVTDGNITITQTSSAAGDVDSSTPSSNNTVTAGQSIEIITDGASSGTSNAEVVIVLDIS